MFLIVQHGDAGGLHSESTQHSTNVLQKEILSSMTSQGANLGYVAFLTDRIKHRNGEPQLYGTVPNANYPIENPENLQDRRSQMQLVETFKEYHERLSAGDKVPYKKFMNLLYREKKK